MLSLSERVNVASALEDRAHEQPEQVAIYYPAGRGMDGQTRYVHYTYRQLLDESDAIARGLERLGIRRGMRTVLMVKPSLEFFALAFGMVRAGIVPVIVDPGMGIRNLKTCLAEAEPEAFIGIPTAHVARLLLGWARQTLKHRVMVGPSVPFAGPTLVEVKQLGTDGSAYQTAATHADETAAIIFTSGSTGVPKGVVYTHGNFAAQLQMLRTAFGIQPGEIDLPTFPVFALFDPALGMTTVIPEMDFTRPARVHPPNIIEPIQRFGVTSMFGSPALLNRVGRYGEAQGVQLPSLRRVLSAGAPVPAKVIARFAKMLAPDVQLYTGYGATEALPVAWLGSQEILGETAAQTDQGAGVCVGYPIAGMEAQIISISDASVPTWNAARPLPTGEIGEIVVKGPSVTRAYYNRPQATALAKIEDSEAVRHRMGDLGYFDAQGRLWFCGRKAHRVSLADETLFTVPLEAIFNTHPQVFRTALVGVRLAGTLTPVLCVELEADQRQLDRNLISEELCALAANHPQAARIQTFLFHPAFPVDIRHNSKIFREKLAVWAAQQLAR
ncbi:MAG: AMP-binding protein [Anaerolineae bacterium]|nr:AMP-binding protein [Anaerolineae bacterium]